MRIAVICNDRLGLPALQQLAQNRLVIAAATSDRSPEIVAIMQQVATQGGIPTQVFTKKNFEADLLAWLELHRPDVVLVKTFPFRIPATALQIPKHGFINFHYAPLPEYRGSNPLFWMIREGKTTGGIAVHRMDEQFDCGPLLLQQTVPFPPDATFGMCSTQLAYAGANLTIQLLQGLQSGQLNAVPQTGASPNWYGRPKPEDLFIRWESMTAKEVKQLVKACNPWMKGSPTRFNGWTVGITEASEVKNDLATAARPGTILALSPEEGLIIACKDGTALKATVIYTEEGFFTGEQLLMFGLKKGDLLH